MLAAAAALSGVGGAPGCDLNEEPSRIPDEEGSGGGVDPEAGGGDPEAGDEALEPGFSSCVEPTAEGNEHGVGRYCEPGGEQCRGLKAQFCAADFWPREASSGCVFSCQSSEECGEGSTCQPDADPENTGGHCVPSECITELG
jgi:hypothetical protein